VLAGVLARRDASALVFRGDDGLDELTPGTRSAVWVVSGGQVREDELNPAELGLAPTTVDDLRGGDATHNAEVAREVLAGGGTDPVRAAVALNAAAALVAAQGTTDEPVVDQLRPALCQGSGGAGVGEGLNVMQRWAKASHQ